MSCPSTQPVWTAQPARGQFINSVAIADDASVVVAGTFYHEYGGNTSLGTFCYDATGSLKWMRPIAGASEGVYWVAISGDGRVAAAGGTANASGRLRGGNGFVQAYDVATGDVLLDCESIPARVNRVALSSDGSVLVAGGASSVYLAIRTPGGPFAAPSAIVVDSEAVSVAISANGQWIVIGTFQGFVHLAENVGGALKIVATCRFPQTPVNMTCHSVQITPSGDWFVASAGGGSVGQAALFNRLAFAVTTLPLWAYPTGGSAFSVAVAGGSATSAPIVAVTSNQKPAGQVVVLATAGSTASPRLTFATQAPPNCVSLDAKGAYVAIADGYNGPGNYYLIDCSTQSCVWTYPTGAMSWPIAIAAHGSAVFAGSDDSSVYYFEP